jgi:hypothetical protein
VPPIAPDDLALLIGGGAVAGFINTLAGGGSFLTVPLLVLAGLPPTDANGTNRVGVFVQNAAAMAGFRQAGVPGIADALRLLPATLAGSWIGAYLASSVSDALFSRSFGVIMLLALPVILRNPTPRAPGGQSRLARWLEHALYLAVGLYGGAIQAGIGIPLLLALAGIGGLDLVRANSVKVVINAALTAVALAQFAWAGEVWWVHGLTLAVGTGAGGYLASRFGARVGPRPIRPLLITVVLALSAYMLISA